MIQQQYAVADSGYNMNTIVVQINSLYLYCQPPLPLHISPRQALPGTSAVLQWGSLRPGRAQSTTASGHCLMRHQDQPTTSNNHQKNPTTRNNPSLPSTPAPPPSTISTKRRQRHLIIMPICHQASPISGLAPRKHASKQCRDNRCPSCSLTYSSTCAGHALRPGHQQSKLPAWQAPCP